jgi:DNA-binding transcriptional regulator YhcF (GntR family)
MIPFYVEFKPGAPIYEQVVYAATKSIISGQLRPGDEFPSVRALSKQLSFAFESGLVPLSALRNLL